MAFLPYSGRERRAYDYFSLAYSASVRESDDQYARVVSELRSMAASDAEEAEKRLKECEDHYYVIIQRHIRVDCSQAGVIRELMEAGESAHEASSTGDSGFDPSIEGHGPRRRGNRFALVETDGDIFDIPDNSIIVHAVNCMGVWGSGFAAQLKARYPTAFDHYVDMCRKRSENIPHLIGSCATIPPQWADSGIFQGKRKAEVWIACLFTSRGYGKRSIDGMNPGRGDHADTLKYTADSLRALRMNIDSRKKEGACIGKLYSPRFNSGNFGLPWRYTKSVIEKSFKKYPEVWTVFNDPARSQETAGARDTVMTDEVQSTIQSVETDEIS